MLGSLGSVDRDALLAALRRCAVVFGSHRVDGHVVVTARGDELVIEAAAVDVAVRSVVPLDEPGVGRAAVPLRILERYVTSVAGRVGLAIADDAMLVVAAGSSRARLHQIADTVMATPDLHGAAQGDLSALDLRQVRRVMHAAATSDAQPALGGIRFEGGHAVACDGYRLAATRLTADLPDALVPLGVVRRVVDEGSAMTMRVSTHQVEFASESVTYWSAPILGDYIDWRSLIVDHDRTPERLEVDRDATLDAVRTVEAMGFGLRQNFGPRVVLEAARDAVVIRSNDETGEVIAEVGGTLSLPSLTFNATYLRQAIESIEGATARGRFERPGRGVLIEDGDHLEIVMPVRS